MTEKEKLTHGMMYDPFTEDMPDLRHKAHELCREYNSLDENDPRRAEIINELIPENNGVYLQGPIQFDYGCMTSFGKGSYANFNLVVVDGAPVKIGENVFIGPNVTLACAIHPLMYEERNPFVREDGQTSNLEYSKPITIGSNCWLAAGVTVCGGATIGEGSVICAGSVVTRDIPPHSFAAGVPARVIRTITEADSVKLKPELWEEEK